MFAGLTWTLALAVGAPAAWLAVYNPGTPRQPLRPGCYIPSAPFKDVYAYSITEPGFVFTLSIVILIYLVMSLFAVLLIIFVCARRTRNNKYRYNFSVRLGG